MGRDTYGLTPLILLLVVLVFGLVWLFPWSELWRRPEVWEAAAKGPRPLKPKTGADCPLCQAQPGSDGVAAGLTSRRWTALELISCPMY
jgi:hypothetical protein